MHICGICRSKCKCQVVNYASMTKKISILFWRWNWGSLKSDHCQSNVSRFYFTATLPYCSCVSKYLKSTRSNSSEDLAHKNFGNGEIPALKGYHLSVQYLFSPPSTHYLGPTYSPSTEHAAGASICGCSKNKILAFFLNSSWSDRSIHFHTRAGLKLNQMTHTSIHTNPKHTLPIYRSNWNQCEWSKNKIWVLFCVRPGEMRVSAYYMGLGQTVCSKIWTQNMNAGVE